MENPDAALLLHGPAVFKRVALMGSVGVPFTMSPEPSKDLGTIARMRYDAAMDPKEELEEARR